MEAFGSDHKKQIIEALTKAGFKPQLRRTKSE